MARGVAAVQLWWGWEVAERRDHGGAELCAAMVRADGVVAVRWRRWRCEGSESCGTLIKGGCWGFWACVARMERPARIVAGIGVVRG